MRKLSVIFMLILVVMMAGCSKPVGETADQAVTSEEASEEVEVELQDYIDFTFVDKDGNDVSISDYEGNFIALNFFGTWCSWCMKEMPDLQSVYNKYQDEGVVILLVNATTTEKAGSPEANKETAIAWYEESGYTMPMVLDLDGTAMNIYPVQGFPTTYFINRDGKVLGAVPGMMDEATLESIIEQYNN